MIGAGIALLMGGAVFMALASPSDPPNELAAGRALFLGERPLYGRIASHLSDLPTEVLRCANCHESAGSPAVARTVAPPLTTAWLLQTRMRHGGPPSMYDLASFCTVLKTGQDPAHLIVNVQMPRYTVSERDCESLWRYIVDEQHD